MSDDRSPFRLLPSIDRLLNDPRVSKLVDTYGREFVRSALRDTLDKARRSIRDGKTSPTHDAIIALAAYVVRLQSEPTLRPVINATGVILQTNLGRAPLCDSAQKAMMAVASNYSTLEYVLDEGRRGKRDSHIETLVRAITGAEAAMVVNNNAAAVMLILSCLARDREVIISRGQLVEIGGGFRIPDVMKDSGAKLVEVGATNRTNLDDYAQAISPQTALLMRVHASNFRQIGFTGQPNLKEMVTLAHKNDLIIADDLGSGTLLDTAPFGLAHEPTVQESLQTGADLVCFSGDKLVGGPQAGIIVGRADLIARLKKHPLARAVRIDKLSLAALVATLDHYRKGDAVSEIPIWKMIALRPEHLKARAEAWQTQVGGKVIQGRSAIGGGSLPGETLRTYVLAFETGIADEITARLRRQDEPVIARISRDRVLFDPRTVLPSQDVALIGSIKTAFAG